jgi:hypothetical protein
LPVLRFNAEIQRLESLNVETVTQNVNFIWPFPDSTPQGLGNPPPGLGDSQRKLG